MIKIQLLFLFVSIIKGLTVSTKLNDILISEVEAEVRSILKKDDWLQNLNELFEYQRTFYNMRIFDWDVRDDFCQKGMDASDRYEYIIIFTHCPNYNKEKVNLQRIQNDIDNYKNVYLSSRLGLHMFNDQETLSKICKNLRKFIGEIDLKMQIQDVSKILDISQMCLARVKTPNFKEEFINVLDYKFDVLLQTAQNINKNTKAFSLKNDAFQLSAKILAQMLKLQPEIQNKKFNQQFFQFLNFFNHINVDNLSLIQKNSYLQFLWEARHITFFKFDNKIKLGEQIIFNQKNIFQQQVYNNVIQSLQIFQNNKLEQDLIFEKNIGKAPKNLFPGIYDLHIKSQNYTQQHVIQLNNRKQQYNKNSRFQKQNIIALFKINNTKILKLIYKMYIYIKIKLQNIQTIKVDQNHKLHLRFQIKQKKIQQVGGILYNSQNQGATNFVKAFLDQNTMSYHIIFDLGDPDVIKPLNDIYQLQLIIFDELIENSMRKNILNVEVSFKNSIKQIQQDTDFQNLPEINHIFKLSEKIPQQIITVFFIIISLLCFAFYFIILQKIGLNYRHFFKSIAYILFFIMILINSGVLVLFWTKINIIQTIIAILFLSLPTLFIGNYALNKLENFKAKSI